MPLDAACYGTQLIRRQVRIAQDHFVGFPAPEFHQLRHRSATLHVPARPSMPEVVEAKVLDPGPTPRSWPRRAAFLNTLSGKGKTPARMLAEGRLQRRDSIRIERDATPFPGLGRA